MEPIKNPKIDPARVRRGALYRLFTAPLVAAPLWLGVGAILLGWLLGNPLGLLGGIGILGILFALGAAAVRWNTHGEQLVQETYEALKTKAERNHSLYLHHLWRRLRVDRDPRTKEYLQQMRQLYQRMERAGVLGRRIDTSLVPEIREKAEQLYRSSLAALERTLDYWNAARQMSTEEARRQATAAREALLEEVGRSIARLNATLDHLQAAALREDDQGRQLAEIREELEVGLEVAKRVEERMAELDRSLRGAGNLDDDRAGGHERHV